ncbi:methylthiotransferase [Thermacetogenium phaeum DSM 12270]|uniref:Methylthiotransferase n=1 Tax=Thermacetogenium phaeum (strain ATCC BAA-254 / DSM 26808 / PB) TaxID=1089553 RepID=K4LCZ7_THEPS|nr:radical SAM protein [Thermacetogenium phaeum]AFV10801.1 methylthiotransferase [Thermacetogenium phaeum DSM 12270]
MRVVLLEHPRAVVPERCNDIANTPLASCLLTGYTAGVLQEAGHEVEIVEGYLDHLSYEEIGRRIGDAVPGLLGVHMVYQWQRDRLLFDFLEGLKASGAVPYIAVYGYYPTFAFDAVLRECTAVDAVVVGEPELTFAELAGRLARGGEIGGIPGLAVRDADGGIRCTRREPVKDLDRLPFPVRTPAMMRLPEVNLQGSRGCYGGCTFCYINPFYGQGSHWRGRSPENIAAEIDKILEKWGKRDFYFTDPNFFGPGERGQKRALRLASLLKDRGVRFGIEARVNDIRDETIGALVAAGLRSILIGLESGRDESLQRMNKRTTVAQNEAALRILRKHGIEPNVGFIMFEPDSTLEDVRANFEFLKRNRLLEKLEITANVLYHHQIVLKGTPAYRELDRSGRLRISDNPYEGTAVYENDGVACLAEVMRGLTNFLFTRLSGVWSGRVQPPPEAPEIFRRANAHLVECFETILSTLEAGGCLQEAERDAFVKRHELHLAGLLAGIPEG